MCQISQLSKLAISIALITVIFTLRCCPSHVFSLFLSNQITWFAILLSCCYVILNWSCNFDTLAPKMANRKIIRVIIIIKPILFHYRNTRHFLSHSVEGCLVLGFLSHECPVLFWKVFRDPWLFPLVPHYPHVSFSLLLPLSCARVFCSVVYPSLWLQSFPCSKTSAHFFFISNSLFSS